MQLFRQILCFEKNKRLYELINGLVVNMSNYL